MKIIRKDADFFRKLNIIDYSLLVGVVRKNEGNLRNEFMNLSSKIANESELESYLKETRYFDNVQKNESYIFGIIDILTEYTYTCVNEELGRRWNTTSRGRFTVRGFRRFLPKSTANVS